MYSLYLLNFHIFKKYMHIICHSSKSLLQSYAHYRCINNNICCKSIEKLAKRFVQPCDSIKCVKHDTWSWLSQSPKNQLQTFTTTDWSASLFFFPLWANAKYIVGAHRYRITDYLTLTKQLQIMFYILLYWPLPFLFFCLKTLGCMAQPLQNS